MTLEEDRASSNIAGFGSAVAGACDRITFGIRDCTFPDRLAIELCGYFRWGYGVVVGSGGQKVIVNVFHMLVGLA